MAMQPIGAVLVDYQMRQMVQDHRLPGHIDSDVQPCSLDLRVGSKMWEIAGIPDLKEGFNSVSFIKDYGYNAYGKRELSRGYTVTRGIYLAQLDGEVRLAPDEWGYVNPKSSSGRIDMHCIVLAEGATQFNTVPRGYHGKLFVLIIPQSFYGVLYQGIALVQLRIFRGNERAFLSSCELRRTHSEYGIISNSGIDPVIDGGHLLVRADFLSQPSNLVPTGTRKPIHLNAKGTTDPAAYFQVKTLDSKGALWLEPGQFALIGSIERVRIPKSVCAEMVPFSDTQGEFRSHYAGFFDRGFGFGRKGGMPGNTVVCEVRNQAPVPIRLSHGQFIARFRFEYLQFEPELVYGEGKQVSHYSRQTGIKLAKFFAPWSK